MKTFCISLLLTLGLSQASNAQIVPERPAAFEPHTASTADVTGPAIVSRERIIFANGAMMLLEPINDQAEDSTKHVFRIAQDPGDMLDGSRLCKDSTATYLEISRALKNETPLLHLTIFDATGNAPADISALCRTLNYTGPQDWITANAPASKPAVQGVETPSPETYTGKWKTRISKNPIDDTKTVMLALFAESGASRWGDPVAFIARCKSNKTDAYANWDTYIGDDSNDVYANWKWVTVRIGDEPATTERWDVSSDHKATFAPSWSGDFLKRMLKADRMVLQITPYGESPITAIFDTSGLDIALKDLAETCSWSY